MTAKRLAAAPTGLLLVLALAGCTAPDPAPTSTAPVVQLGAPGEPGRTLSPEEAAALTSPDYVEADVLFARDMLHHHAQALVMTGYVDDRTRNQDIRLIAERMEIGQTDEIALIERWLQERAEPVRDPDAAHDDHAGMPGLLTDAELAELEAARDGDFDRLFLEFMIRHHQGAVEMVTALYADSGAQEQQIDTIAREIESDQNIEILRMQELLADLS